jgi:hypothetical protein
MAVHEFTLIKWMIEQHCAIPLRGAMRVLAGGEGIE